MYAQLGTTVFERLFSPDSIRKDVGTANYADIDRVVGKPVTQRIGMALTAMAITLRLNNAWCDPAAEIAKLEASAANGEALALIMGDGSYEGLFVIRELSIDRITDLPNSTIVEAVVSVGLTEYVTDSNDRPFNGFALSTSNPSVAARRPAISSPSAIVMQDLSVGSGAALKSGNAAKSAVNGASDARSKARDAQKALEDGKAAMKRIEKTTMDAERLQNQSASVVAQARQAERNMERMQDSLGQFLETGNAANLTDSVRSLNFSMDNLKTACAPVAGLGAMGKG